MKTSYIHLVADATQQGEETMHQSVRNVSELLDRLYQVAPDDVEEFLRKEYANLYGEHYNEELAKEDVAETYHVENGTERRGEHWSKTQTDKVADKYGIKDYWDVYVALNVHYHDKAVLYQKWFSTNADDKIIEDAVKTYFFDDDAENKNIYNYMTYINSLDAGDLIT